MEIASADLTPIRELYGEGLYVRAYRIAEQYGPLKDWSNPAARLLGGRLATQLGAPRLGRLLHLRAFRDTPSHPEAIYYHARYRLERFGPLAAWQFLRKHPDWSDAPPELRADWCGLHGFVAARLRDADRAERWLNRAEATAPGRPWLCIERAAAYEFAERFEDALAAARRSMELQPWFRPGVQATAHLLQLLGREAEALDLLTEADARLESGIVVAQLAGMQIDLRRHADARRSYERYAELSPLMEEEIAKWLAARRADTAYFCGDVAAARENAAQVDEPFYKEFALSAERGARSADRQEGEAAAPITSVPATIRLPVFPEEENPALRAPRSALRALDALARFWGLAPKSPAPPETGGFDGLPDPRERRWAEENGWVAREFTVTPEAAFALLERGVPFLLTLVDAGYGHSQAVVGGDRLRNSLLIREPAERREAEAPLATLRERYAATGPRALVFVPPDRAHLLDGIDLPEAPLYDVLHRLQSALLRYDRPDAAAAHEELLRVAPDHRLTLQARCVLARYDGNLTEMLRAVGPVLAKSPEDVTFVLSKQATLRDLGRREERLEFLRGHSHRPNADPIVAQHYAQLLLPDPHFHPEAQRLLERSARRRPYGAAGYYILANVFWERRRFVEAVELYRFAACLDDRDEQFAEAYFRAARAIDQTPEAMRFLQARFNRDKARPSAARALFYALSEQEEIDSAFAILDQAIEQASEALPAGARLNEEGPAATSHEPRVTSHEFGDLLLFAAEMRANHGQMPKALELLEAARAHAAPASWHRVAARVANLRVDLFEARRHEEAILAEEPLATDVLRNLARHIADTEGRAAAVAHLRAACARHSHHHPLHQLLIDWLRAEPAAPGDPAPAEPVIRQMLELCPDDAWAQRELALHLANHRRTDEALAAAEAAGKLESRCPSYFYTLGHVYQKADRTADARAAYQDAIRLSVDNDLAITELVNLVRGLDEKRDELEFVAAELGKQPLLGDGLLTFRDQALNVFEPEELLNVLHEALDEHPDVWQPWSAVVNQLTTMGRLEEARELATAAVERFPLLARLWADLSEVCQAQEDEDGQIDSLRKALEVAPGWSPAARELAEVLEQNDQPAEARAVLEQAIARAPLDPVNYGYLAESLWEQGESAAALERLGQALRLDPGYEWAWRALGDWSERMECPERVIETAREAARLRPGDPRVWLSLARTLHGPQHSEEVLRALDRALALNPHSVEAYDLKAERLAELGRFDEAKAAATPEVFRDDPPVVLQGRAAWVEARRGNFAAAIPPMQALVAIEPNYYWGWQQLAEWHNETGRPAAYLEAASELVNLRPDSPVALAMRGEARLQTGDRGNGKADLREAQRIAPNYSFAGMLLFDAYLADEEYANARAALAVLQEHIGGSGRPFVMARQAQLAARTRDREPALEALREVCEMPCESAWPVQTAVQELRGAGWADLVDGVLREAWESGGPFHPWAVLAWLDGPEGQKADPEARLRALDRAIAANPRYLQAYDVKAEQLVRAKRFDDALRACRPEVFGPQPPLILRGREAWVLAQRGDRAAAVALMRELVTADRDYYWGWQQLANWYDTEGAYADYLEAAEQLVRLAPTDPSAYGYRGEAKTHLGDRAGAKADFGRAYDLDPDYAFAGLHLLDAQLADDELADAAETLAKLEEHVGGPYVRLRAVRLAVRNQDKDAALDYFAEMGEDDEAPYGLLRKTFDALAEAGWAEDADAALEGMIDDEDAAPPVGRLWAERRAARGDWDGAQKLTALLGRDELGQEALFAFVESLGQPAQAARLALCLQQFGDVLKDSERGWAKAGSALVGARNFALAAAWLADWQKRSPKEPWMLHPLARALRATGREGEAYQASRHALDLPAGDATVGDHLVWVALEDALAGRTAGASSALAGVDRLRLDDGMRVLYALAEALLMVQKAPPGERSKAFAEARDHAKTALGSVRAADVDPGLARTYRRVASRLAKDAGGLKAWAWNLWQQVRPPVAGK